MAVTVVAAVLMTGPACAEQPARDTRADQSGLAQRVNRSEQDYTAPNISPDQQFSVLGMACEVTLVARKTAGAMVTLELKAPCHGNEVVTFSHHGLLFSSATSEVGHITLSIPAMTAAASFDAMLGDGSTVSASVAVPEVSDYDRVALQWAGNSDIGIHAYELGAGERGHVWTGSEHTVATALQARGGYITTLGGADAGLAKHVQIYTFPSGQIKKSGVVRLAVQVKITAETCGKNIDLQALQNGVTGTNAVSELTLSMPACDAIGDVLVLNNLLRDLKITQN